MICVISIVPSLLWFTPLMFFLYVFWWSISNGNTIVVSSINRKIISSDKNLGSSPLTARRVCRRPSGGAANLCPSVSLATLPQLLSKISTINRVIPTDQRQQLFVYTHRHILKSLKIIRERSDHDLRETERLCNAVQIQHWEWCPMEDITIMVAANNRWFTQKRVVLCSCVSHSSIRN